VAHRKTTIAGTRGSSARLDIIDDGLRIWFWGKSRPMGVVPSTFLLVAQYLIRLLQRGETSGCTLGVVLIFVRMMDECKPSEGALS
jgi:hypothetical protein